MTKNSFYVSDILKHQESEESKTVVCQFQDQSSADLTAQDLILDSNENRQEDDLVVEFDGQEEEGEIVVDGDYKHQVSGLCLQWKFIEGQWMN